MNASNLKIGQYSTRFYYIKALKSIFDPFAPTCANLDLCQVESLEKTQLTQNSFIEGDSLDM